MYGIGKISSKSATRTRLCYPGSTILGSVHVNSYSFTDLNVSNLYLKDVASEERVSGALPRP